MALVVEAVVLDWRIEVAHPIVRHIQIREIILVKIIVIIVSSTLPIRTSISSVSASALAAKHLDLLVTYESKYQ